VRSEVVGLLHSSIGRSDEEMGRGRDCSLVPSDCPFIAQLTTSVDNIADLGFPIRS
jgi:hypothetical protein